MDIQTFFPPRLPMITRIFEHKIRSTNNYARIYDCILWTKIAGAEQGLKLAACDEQLFF